MIHQSEKEKISLDLETMRKDYKPDAIIVNNLIKTPEDVVDFDRTWNGTYSFVKYRECNGPMLGHRAEKCRKLGGSYNEAVVKRFETNLKSSKRLREILNTFMDTKRKEEIHYKQNREMELQKGLPQKTSLMIGTTEIPKWVGQDFDVSKKDLEK